MNKLSFGYNAGVPDDAPAAWGCRAIVGPNGYVDVVWDRQDAVGPDEARLPLLEHLRSIGVAPFDRARELLRAEEMLPSFAQEHILHEDERVVVKGNTNASHGYLYVCAYPKAA